MFMRRKLETLEIHFFQIKKIENPYCNLLVKARLAHFKVRPFFLLRFSLSQKKIRFCKRYKTVIKTKSKWWEKLKQILNFY